MLLSYIVFLRSRTSLTIHMNSHAMKTPSAIEIKAYFPSFARLFGSTSVPTPSRLKTYNLYSWRGDMLSFCANV